MVAQSWLRNLWGPSKKPDLQAQKSQISVLAFESASLMTKLLHLWQSLNDKQVARLREDVSKSAGIKKLVSEDDDYIGKLICLEMTENLSHVACAVARLSKKCNDPLLKSFEQAFSDLSKIGEDPYCWQFSWKKMDRKIKKMGRFILANTSLHQEMQSLGELEQTLKRLKGNGNADSITLVEYEKKVAWKRHEVKRLKENSLWCRTYDYTILLLARSVFTVYGRIGFVFGINQVYDVVGVKDSNKFTDIFNSRRGHSTVFMQQSSVYPSENYVPRFSIGLSGKFNSHSGPLPRTNHNSMGNFNSGPLGNSTSTCSPIPEKYEGPGIYSRPLHSSSTRSGPISRAGKSSLKLWQFRSKKPNSANISGPLTGCVTGENSPPTNNNISYSNSSFSNISNSDHGNSSRGNVLVPASNNKSKLLSPPPDSLGAAALALHYANVVIFIEKLAVSPHSIGSDARNDLYSMLPASIRASLRAKLKPYAQVLSSSVYNMALVGEWNEAIMKTLEWFAPMAHNMIRWQSERSFEHQSLVSRTNVLLVQTLYFANQEKAEAAITEILVGLNYIWRFGKDVNAKSVVEESASERTIEDLIHQTRRGRIDQNTLSEVLSCVFSYQEKNGKSSHGTIIIMRFSHVHHDRGGQKECLVSLNEKKNPARNPKMTDQKIIDSKLHQSVQSWMLRGQFAGRTHGLRLIAKYRPTMPVLSVVIPRLKTNQLRWTFTGAFQARQSLIVRGLFPMLADPRHPVRY